MKKSTFKTIFKNFVILLLAGLTISLNSIVAQDESQRPGSKSSIQVLEVVDDPYSPSPRENHPTSPAYKYLAPGFYMTQVNVDGDGNNIVGDAGNEPSITYDPTNPGRMAIGWRQFDDIGNNFRQAGLGFTTDAGQNWTFPGVIEPGIFRSDPVLDCDTSGNFFYNSLTVGSGDYWCDVFKSEDGGATWGEAVFAQGGDKQWMTIDKSDGIGSGNIYAFWNSSYSICEPDFFTRSVNGGLSYEDCTTIDGYPYWGTNTVDAEGNLYACGMTWDGFMVARSSTAQNPAGSVTWDYNTYVDLDGWLVGFGGYDCPNPSGLLGQTIIDVDRSGGPNHGNVYLLASVERMSNNDPLDVMFSKSTDGGLTWSSPYRVNDDAGNNAYQWFGTLSVAPNGRIDVVWLDTRDNPGSVNSKLYYTYSLDAGETWSENIALSDSFDPHLGWPDQDKMGDYFDMFSDETGAHLAWAATFNGEQDVYYGHIDFSTVGINTPQITKPARLSQNYPNPFNDNTTINFHLADKGHVSLKVYDMAGREILTLVNGEKSKGNHHVALSADKLEEGFYFYSLQVGDFNESKKLMLIK